MIKEHCFLTHFKIKKKPTKRKQASIRSFEIRKVLSSKPNVDFEIKIYPAGSDINTSKSKVKIRFLIVLNFFFVTKLSQCPVIIAPAGKRRII